MFRGEISLFFLGLWILCQCGSINTERKQSCQKAKPYKSYHQAYIVDNTSCRGSNPLYKLCCKMLSLGCWFLKPALASFADAIISIVTLRPGSHLSQTIGELLSETVDAENSQKILCMDNCEQSSPIRLISIRSSLAPSCKRKVARNLNFVSYRNAKGTSLIKCRVCWERYELQLFFG